jgi:hypothetical protein
LFERRFQEGVADGSVTLTFRRWKRRQAVPGHRYRTVAGTIHVDSVDVVAPSTVTDAEARLAGAAALVGDLRGTDDLAPLPRHLRCGRGSGPARRPGHE